MAMTALPGIGYAYYPFDYRLLEPTTLIDYFRLDGTRDKLAMGGRFWHSGRTTESSKSIRHVGFQFCGTVVKSGGSSLKVSLQGVEGFVAADTPKPNGAIGQSVTIANGDASFAANQWYRATLDTSRSVFMSERLAVVWEWNGSRLGSDGVSIALREQFLGDSLETPWGVGRISGTWARFNATPIVVLETDDGEMCTLDGAYITSFPNTLAFNAFTTHTEYGIQFTLPWTCRVDGAVILGLNGIADCQVGLYNSTTLLASSSYDAQHVSAVVDLKEVTFAQTDLAANQPYILAVKATGAGSNFVQIQYESLFSAAHRSLWGDTNLSVVRRTGSGEWSSHSTTQAPLMGVRLSAFDSG